MKRKFMSAALIAAMLLVGCGKDASINKKAGNEPTAVAIENQTPSNNGGNTIGGNSEGKVTLSEIKAKYATVTTSNVIEPLYNVAPDEEFEFKFKYDLTMGGYGAESIVSVHTDVKCLKDSMIYTYATPTETEDGGSLLTIAPIRAVLETNANEEDYFENDHAVWGNAPMYYIAIWYDMEADTLTKLAEPIVIPFTIKQEVQAPEVKGVVDSKGCFSLQWEPVEGATEYRIYTFSKSSNWTGDTNEAMNGAEYAYGNGSLLYLDTVEGDKTSFMNFAGEGGNIVEFERNVSGKVYVISQNPCVNSDYYVSAVVDGKESGFASAVKTADLKIPYKPTAESDIMFSRYTDVADLPLTLDVINIDGSISKRNVMYTFQWEKTYLEGVMTPEYVYSIEGTAITGCVSMDVEDPNYEFPQTIGESSLIGTTEPEDDIKSQPDMDIESIPEDAPDDGSVISDKIEESNKNSEGAEEEIIETPASAMTIFAENAAEEWIALNLINGETEISLEAFPELQTKDALVDVLLKTYHQNPYVLGLYKYGYNYQTKTLLIEYVYNDEERTTRQQEILEKANKVVSEIIKDDMTDEEKQMAIYKYLEENASYDHEALEAAEKNNFVKVKDANHEDAFNAYGILVKEVGVCQSYANVYKLLCRLSGLECNVATGYLSGSLPHAWNYVKIDGKWYQSDITNNGKTTGIPFYLYNADSDTAAQTGYSSDTQFEIDTAIVNYNSDIDEYEYYHANEICAESIEEYKEILAKELPKNTDIVYIRYEGTMPSQEDLAKATIEVYNMAGMEEQLKTATFMTASSFILLKTK